METNINKGEGRGFISKDGKICMTRCFECGRENYAAAVTSGCCVWCGHDANEDTSKKEDSLNVSD